MKDLFTQNKANSPLADRMRPRNFQEFVGQEDIAGKGKILRRAIDNDELPSVIFWGPPGTGKTTLANIIAHEIDSDFVEFSAVSSGLKDLREVIKKAEDNNKFYNKKTILFIDEIHRWNKAQQDALLPHVEKGTVILIGATTENPSFEVISALLSRAKVFVLESLGTDDLKKIIVQALNNKERGLGKFKVEFEDGVFSALAKYSSGDARKVLNTLEVSVLNTKPNKKGVRKITLNIIKDILQNKSLKYDKAGEEHYNIISALHKSMRGSDPDASLYWLGRMLEAGDDPLYIARRVVRFASEDIGLADPQALPQAVTAYQACHFIGMPECNVILAQAVVYCAKAKKSNELYSAYGEVQKDIKETENDPVPLHLRNAPTKLMKELDYGKDYKYNPDHDYEGDIQDYLPEKLKGKRYFRDKG